MSAPDDREHGARDRDRTDRAAGRRKGREWFGTLCQLDFDIDLFERVIARNDRSVEALRALGELASRKGLHDRAVEVDRRLVACLPDDCLVRYNLACSLAVAGHADDSLECLAAAIHLGYRDIDYMRADPDLASLRDRPEFRALLRS
ncbi:MAG: TPR end-of-group domain-containing protein [Pirellulales bacterium]